MSFGSGFFCWFGGGDMRKVWWLLFWIVGKIWRILDTFCEQDGTRYSIVCE
jgi:hypothetical protein